MNEQATMGVAWITGGGSGIGRAAALALGTAGFHVVVSGRRQAELEETVRLVHAEQRVASALTVDVGDGEAVHTAAQRIEAEHGPVTLLVCAAGLNVPRRSWADVRLQDYRRVASVNLDGVVHTVHAVLPAMRSRGAGTIVVISSWAGREFLPVAGMAYGATKAALSPLVESLNCEEGHHGIRASLVMPGEVVTPMLMTRPQPPSAQDFERMLQPEDLGNLIRFIATAPPRMCVGEVLIGPTWNRIYIGADDMRVTRPPPS